ncbi:hypothetical protein Leryth_006192 [Lithospermum erythrorhizon]|nr:hypothetical protein Leryth_006192 [Lithospermum erythrorhizon]
MDGSGPGSTFGPGQHSVKSDQHLDDAPSRIGPVQCGLGRTGYLWAHEAYGIYLDIMTLAKPLAGGLPIGAVLVKKMFGDHGSTFAGSPLVCHAATATLDKISEPSFLASVSKKGKYFKEMLVQKLGSNKHVKDIRGAGLIIGIELEVSASSLVDKCWKSGLLVLTAEKATDELTKKKPVPSKKSKKQF